MLPPATDSAPPRLGVLQGVYRAENANLVAGIIIGCLPIGGGLWFVAAACADGWGPAVVGIVFAFLMSLMGWVILRFVYELWLRRVEVYDNGFVFAISADRHAVPWDEVHEVRETVSYERVPILVFPFDRKRPPAP